MRNSATSQECGVPNDSTRSAAREPLGKMEVSGSGRVAVLRPDALIAVALVERPRLVLDGR